MTPTVLRTIQLPSVETRIVEHALDDGALETATSDEEQNGTGRLVFRVCGGKRIAVGSARYAGRPCSCTRPHGNQTDDNRNAAAPTTGIAILAPAAQRGRRSSTTPRSRTES